MRSARFRHFRTSAFDALVMLGPAVPEPLLAGRVPLVVIGWHVDHPDVDIVRTSDEHGIGLAIDHLVELGHRRIVHLQGGTSLVAVARRDAYITAMRRHGLEAEIQVVACEGEDQLDGQRAARALLDAGREMPTALVTFNDDIAAAAMSVLTQHGIQIPADISIVGFDDATLARARGRPDERATDPAGAGTAGGRAHHRPYDEPRRTRS